MNQLNRFAMTDIPLCEMPIFKLETVKIPITRENARIKPQLKPLPITKDQLKLDVDIDNDIYFLNMRSL